MPIDPVLLQLKADVNDYNARISQAQRLTDQKLDAIERRGFAMGQSIKNSFSMASRSALQFAAGFATIQGAQALIAIADEAKTLEAQLRLATQGFGSFGRAQEDVRRIAAETRSGLSDTAALYGNFARASKEMGATQGEAARATETFSKTLKISGADAGQAASATLQFGQALASGALRGDELNSILEASPRLARLLAESMGKPIGEIKKMGEAGELTSEKLLRALTDQKFTESIDSEFKQMPVTFSQAMTQVQNAAVITFGAFDRGGQFSSILANFVADGADGFRDLEQAAVDMGIGIRGQLAGLAAAFEPVIQAANDLMAAMRAASQFGGGAQGSKEFLRGTADDLYRWAPDSVIGRGAKRFIDADNQKRAELQRGERRRGYAAELSGPGLPFTYFGMPQAPAAAASRVSSAKPKKGPAGPSAETLANRAAAEAKRIENERLKGIRDEAAQRRDAARLDDDILAAKAALATAADSILQFQLDAIESERKQRVADIETDVKLGDLGRQEADRRILINNELAQLHGDLAKRRTEEAKAALAAAAQRDTIDTLKVEASLLDTREKRRDAERRILDLAYKEEEAAIRRAAAAGQIADLEEALANMKRRQAADTTALERDHASPLQNWAKGMNEKSLADRGEELVVREIESLREGMSSAINNALGIKDDFFGGLVTLLLDEILFRPLAEALEQGAGGLGGGGGFLGAVGGLLGGLFGRASGGSVSGGQMYRVNEGAGSGRVEGFIPRGSGEIIPLGRMNAVAAPGAQTGGQINVTVTLSDDLNARIDNRARDVSVQVTRATAPEIIDLAAKTTVARAERPRI